MTIILYDNYTENVTANINNVIEFLHDRNYDLYITKYKNGQITKEIIANQKMIKVIF